MIKSGEDLVKIETGLKIGSRFAEKKDKKEIEIDKTRGQ